MKNIKSLEDMFTDSVATNEGADYRSKCTSMKNYLDDMAKSAMSSVKKKGAVNSEMMDTNITISVGKKSINIPFNADSYERLITLLQEEIKDDKELDA